MSSDNNGGSSSWYDITIPSSLVKFNFPEEGLEQTITIQPEDVIDFMLGGDFHKGEILKALCRMGKKEGVSDEYNLNKIIYRAERLKLLEKIKNG